MPPTECIYQVSNWNLKACWRKVWKTRTDGRTDIAMHTSFALQMWVLLYHSVHAFDMSIIIIFVYLGLWFKWNQLSSNNSHHTGCIYKGLHAGKQPDLLTSKADADSTLRYHWTDNTGITLADAIAQWSSRGNPELKIHQLLRGKQCLNSLGSARSCCNSRCVIWSKYFCLQVHATGPGSLWSQHWF